MNLNLSQARAQSVLNALRARRILTGSFVAKGYGEDNPIASNSTEDGREANRRIEFRLIESELPDAEDAEDEGDSGTDETAETAPAQAEPEEDTDGQ